MEQYLTIGDAAKRLGLNVDTVRRLARKGAIKAARTTGGHRRFRVDEVDRFKKARNASPCAGTGARRKAPAPQPPLPAYLRGTLFDDPWLEDDDVGEVPPDVDADGDWPDDEPAPAVPPVVVSPAQLTPRMHPVAPAVPFVAEERAKHADARRLQAIKTSVLATLPWDTPSEWQAKVAADLERYVTAREFPSGLATTHAITLAQTRVREVLAPWAAAQATAKADRATQEEARRKLDALRAHGRRYAVGETSGWDWSAQTEARRGVETAVATEVAADWSPEDVEDLVDDVLAEWDDDDSDDEA